MDCRCLVGCVLVLTSIVNVKAIAEPMENAKLLDHLMKNYNPKLRPAGKNTTITINVDFNIKGIIEFNELQQFISTSGYFTITWTDDLLTWNEREFGGEDELVLTQKDVWLPDVAIINFHSGLQDISPEFVRLEVFSDGTVRWYAGGVYKTVCAVDMKYFPFDTQRCEIHVGSWTYGFPAVDWKFSPKCLDTDQLIQNGVWKLTDTDCSISRHNNYTEVAFKIFLKRTPEMYVLDTILPVILLSVLNVIVFKVPVESGERLSYSITVLLSFAVFMTVISSSMPKNGESISILTVYVAIMISLSALIVILTALTLKLYHTNCKVPRWMCFCLRRKKHNYKIDRSEATSEMTWQQVTSYADTLFFWSLLFIMATLTMCCMAIVGYQL